MKSYTFMLIAGEASGDLLAAELVAALRARLAEVQARPTADAQPLRTSLPPRFFGAGGPKMAEAGVELAFDLTRHSVIGLWEVVRNLRQFRRLFGQLRQLAVERQPDAIIGVDYGGFNLRFAAAIQRRVRARAASFNNWRPKLIQCVSPQVWASRPGRAVQMERDLDLLLSIFPFEPAWYARHAPRLKVEFVGHPIFDRHPRRDAISRSAGRSTSEPPLPPPVLLLLPGSRVGEVRRHLPVMLETVKRVRARLPAVQVEMVLPTEALLRQARATGLPSDLRVQVGGLPEALRRATVVLSKTGTVTVECAYFGVPTVTLYQTSWPTYLAAKQVVSVPWLSMPNLLAHEAIFPEFVQADATPENLSRATLELLEEPQRRQRVQTRLAEVVASLGSGGASARAATAVVDLLLRG